MEILKRYDGSKHEIYSHEEALQKGFNVKHWMESKAGDWAVTDDGFVGKCISRAPMGNGKYDFVRLAHGVGISHGKMKINYLKNREYNCFTALKPRPWVEREAAKNRTKNAVDAYVTQVLSNDPINWEVIGKIYRKDQPRPDLTVRKLFKQERIKLMVKEELAKVLTSKGITQEMVIDLHNEAIEIAKGKGDVGNILRAAENFMDLLNMKPDKKITTERIELGVTNKILDEIATEEKKTIALEQKREEIDIAE